MFRILKKSCRFYSGPFLPKVLGYWFDWAKSTFPLCDGLPQMDPGETSVLETGGPLKKHNISSVLPVCLSTCLCLRCFFCLRESCCHGAAGQTPVQVSTSGLDECDRWVYKVFSYLMRSLPVFCEEGCWLARDGWISAVLCENSQLFVGLKVEH